VLFEMLTLERLFRGKDASEVLEKVVSGHIPRVRDRNPAVPREVAAIVEQSLMRDPARRFASAAAMGEACEHFLYDKGYGPTNLTLKRHLGALFPTARVELAEAEERFPAVQPTLIPIGDPTPPSPARGATGAAKAAAPSGAGYTRVVTERPATTGRAAKRRAPAAESIPTTHKLPATAKLPTTRRVAPTMRTRARSRGRKRRSRR
jgi:hypothetical protein